jgi:hypothetical protein
MTVAICRFIAILVVSGKTNGLGQIAKAFVFIDGRAYTGNGSCFGSGATLMTTQSNILTDANTAELGLRQTGVVEIIGDNYEKR